MALVQLRVYPLVCGLIGALWAPVGTVPDSKAQTRSNTTAKPVTYVRAFVVDDRLATLRHDPDQTSQLIQRMHLGRAVYIIGSKVRDGEAPLYRVAVTRRTRGWVHQEAIAVPGRPGEDQRVWNLIGKAEELDRIALCKLLAQRFPRSRLAAAALLLIGEEAERAAKTLTRRAKKRLVGLGAVKGRAVLRDYYLNDSSLDRYSKLGVRFDFDESSGEFVYDKQAYRQVLARYSATKEAETARQRLGPAVQGRNPK